MDFHKISSAKDIPLTVKALYLDSFPEEERRDWADIAGRIDMGDPFFSFYVLQHNSEDVGFMTLWRLPGSLYCEHFAIFPQQRGKGIGKAVVGQALEMSGRLPFVLEVELPEASTEAARRIRFYERCGLTALTEFPYYQPPYRPGLPDVAMMLMTSRPIESPSSLAIILHTLVYNQ